MPPLHSLSLDRGTVIDGRYRLLGPIGRGGMAEVWLARHEDLRQSVAIKFVDRALLEGAEGDAAEEILERFRFEAQVAAHLAQTTSHVVAVRDAGTHEGLPFFVMEYVEGVTLEREIKAQAPMALGRVADILDQIAEALDAAHAMGIVHRDLKPANILLEGTQGAVVAKLADFGIAKALSSHVHVDRPRATIAGAIVGSPMYMSPEQLRGEGAVDGRSDVWSLGVVAYEAITGAACFEHEGVQLATQILMATPKPPSSRRPGLPSSVDAWFTRILAKSQDQRFQSAGEAAAAFRAALITRKPASRVSRASRLLPAPELAVRVALAVCLVGSLLAGPMALAAVSDKATERSARTPTAMTLPSIPQALRHP